MVLVGSFQNELYLCNPFLMFFKAYMPIRASPSTCFGFASQLGLVELWFINRALFPRRQASKDYLQLIVSQQVRPNLARSALRRRLSSIEMTSPVYSITYSFAVKSQRANKPNPASFIFDLDNPVNFRFLGSMFMLSQSSQHRSGSHSLSFLKHMQCFVFHSSPLAQQSQPRNLFRQLALHRHRFSQQFRGSSAPSRSLPMPVNQSHDSEVHSPRQEQYQPITVLI